MTDCNHTRAGRTCPDPTDCALRAARLEREGDLPAPTSLQAHLSSAAADLTWLVHPDLASVHDGVRVQVCRYDEALALLADTRTQALILAGSVDPSGVPARSKGSHSDPTALAALGRVLDVDGRKVDVVERSRRRTKELRSMMADICEAARFVQTSASLALYDAVIDHPTTIDPLTALACVEWCNTIGRTIGPKGIAAVSMLRQSGRTEDANELHHGFVFLADQAKILRNMVHAELASRVRPVDQPAPKQQPLKGCRSCQRDNGYFEPIDVDHHNAREMCRVCGDFYVTEGELLPVGAVRYRHRTGKRLTNKIIEQAKRQEKAS